MSIPLAGGGDAPSASFKPSEDQISALVDHFYARVREDEEIGPIFNANVESWPAHLALLKDFWSTVLLTSGRYKGNPMLAHFPLTLTAQSFNRWLTLFEQTAKEVMAPEAAAFVVQRAHSIATNMRRVLPNVQ